MTRRRCLLVFTKPARPGRVKTRLIGERLSASDAAELHGAFLADLLERLQDCGFDIRVLWAVDPEEPLPALSLPSLAQQGDDLGARLRHGLEAALREYQGVVAVGSDHPDLPAEYLSAAFEALEARSDLVLGPALDGGYYLIGARPEVVCDDLFTGVEWSTAGVLQRTLENARRLHLAVELLPTARDVDTAEDLEALAAVLATAPERCPRTHALLAKWNRIPTAAGNRIGR